jgi:hypothetical protein
MPASTHYFGERRQVRLACIECRAKKVHLKIHYRRKSSALISTGQVHWRKDWLRQMQHQRNTLRIPGADGARKFREEADKQQYFASIAHQQSFDLVCLAQTTQYQ